MSATRAVVDLDDTEGLIAADRDGLLRAVAMAGAQVRAAAAAVEEGALDSVRGARPRAWIWLSRRGPAESAGALLTALLGGAAGQPMVLCTEVPPWIGPLDVLVLAGDDPADPVLVNAAVTAVRRGARVVVCAPYEGPLREATAGRVGVLEPRLWVPEEFGLCRYLAAGIATVQAAGDSSGDAGDRAGDKRAGADLSAMADALDAEALRNSAARELFTNAAKSLAERVSGRATVLAGDNPATLTLAQHAATAFLRIAHQVVTPAGLADALVAVRGGGTDFGVGGDDRDAELAALFHDEELDGPLPQRLRVLALTLGSERQVVTARVAGHNDIDVVGAEDVPDTAPVDAGRPEQQLGLLALRLEMAAVYLRLARG
ncbi:TobH protein [Mycolicibacterium palauense]|uniref:TobH protein n=1 Tax=Mycolicibacterium palauense TaxID=2034511 RepID=UPI000BFEB22A|nr:TobH protein [Mycolicibacterium palauense]